ncbi:MAG: hypothetical protein ACRD7E_03810 [Bryobacteraceae bacterium]
MLQQVPVSDQGAFQTAESGAVHSDEIGDLSFAQGHSDGHTGIGRANRLRRRGELQKQTEETLLGGEGAGFDEERADPDGINRLPTGEKAGGFSTGVELFNARPGGNGAS